jgi:hypothetical protein
MWLWLKQLMYIYAPKRKKPNDRFRAWRGSKVGELANVANVTE